MSKVIDSKLVWFQEVAPRSFYDEDDLERVVIQNLESIFPQFKAILFKKRLLDVARTKTNVPDLAMIKFDYSEWFVIEVELGKHAKDHVIDQITTFYNCRYSEEHADYMYLQRPEDFDQSRLRDMVLRTPPDFMVIVNETKPEWVADLKLLRCKTCVFQIYQDESNNPIYRLNGEHPYIYTNFAHCRYQKGIPFMVEVLDRDFLDSYHISNGSTLNIEFQGKSFQWKRENNSSRVFLQCLHSRPPLDPLSDRYKLNYNKPMGTFFFTKD